MPVEAEPVKAQFSLPTIEKVRYMYAELSSLFYDGDTETTDVKAKIVKRLLARNPNAMCEASYLIAVKEFMDELNNRTDTDDFDFSDWLDRYISVLPPDPLEALSYDLVIYKIFSREYVPH